LSLPCICYKCARYISLKTLNDPECLLIEEQGCKNMHCHNCTFTCARFIEITDTYKKIPDDSLVPGNLLFQRTHGQDY